MLVNIKDLFVNRKYCAGWITIDRSHKGRVVYQNDNDLGLLGEDMDEWKPVNCIGKIRIAPKYWVYVLDENCSFDLDETVTKAQALALLKECHQLPLTQAEQRMLKRYWAQF